MVCLIAPPNKARHHHKPVVSDMLEGVSIVIPVGPDETALNVLLTDLQAFDAEIIVSRENTRAKALNAGAAKAQHNTLWFLHADSRVSDHNVKSLQKALQQNQGALHYFDLKFDQKGLPQINGWGANMRSYIFGAPYGDQGFCISKSQFERAGRFPEGLDYGEDLMFVWHARQSGIKLNRIQSKLTSSARKYKIHGWFKLTCIYQYKWIKMSLPEMWKLHRGQS